MNVEARIAEAVAEAVEIHHSKKNGDSAGCKLSQIVAETRGKDSIAVKTKYLVA